ncbi:peptide chain release factor N(5)-glutamine methyltransferase [Luteimonas sp. RD2P54]|uniref:Release factor glutamine methyltransferase n=1 Tax=Luteimonas endophytica TaxID=3042023 RepID=A0ABT6J6G9_9GAMM|nr:peptide chain release factor N(5)-glutamine methyltransferase [Luteimonas endophytica]MDH5822157.1 peptide chain release factor N(5)-glutamine methyltransferase [Luteimonas endophytica]
MNRPSPLRVDAMLRRAAGRIDREDALHLLEHALARPRAWLYAHGDAPVADAAAAAFEALVARRAAGEPVAYLTGRRGFWTLDLAVTPDTLIPRPETELLVELALGRLAPDAPLAVADLGTGSGAIALAIARERPRARVVATDRSAAALAVAAANAAANAIANVEFRAGHWYAPLAGERYALIASNPPYIAAGDAHLQRGDLRFEPDSALVSGPVGLEAIRAIAAGALAHLGPGGWLLLEHGHGQGDAVREILRREGLADIATAADLERRERVTLGRAGARAAGW